MSDIEQQFAGNYVRLVNQCRDLQADIVLKDRMIADMADVIADSIRMAQTHGFPYCEFTNENIIESAKKVAQEKLVAEQNKKAAESNASI